MKYTPPTKGKPKQTPPSSGNLGDAIYSVSALTNELNQLKTDLVSTVDDKIAEIDTKVSDALENLTDTTQILQDTKEQALANIKEIKQGEPGTPADEKAIVSRLTKLIPPKLDTKALTVEILSKVKQPDVKAITRAVLKAIPSDKPSLKIIRESIEVDPISVIEKIMALRGKFKLTTANIDGLDQTIRAFQFQLGRGYLHGGGDTIVAGSRITITPNPNGTKTISTSGLGSISIGDTVLAGTPKEVLYIDNTGNLFGDTQFTRDSVTHETHIQRTISANLLADKLLGGLLITGSAITITGSLSTITDQVSGDVGFAGTADLSTFGFTNEASIMGHVAANGDDVTIVADELAGVPLVRFNASTATTSSQMDYTPTNLTFTGNINGTVFDVNDTTQKYILNKLGGGGVRIVTTDNLGVLGATTSLAGLTLTSPLLLPDGTSSLPGIAFASEPSMGFYRPQAGNIYFPKAVGFGPFGTGAVFLTGGNVAVNSVSGIKWSGTTNEQASTDTTLGRFSAGVVGVGTVGFSALGSFIGANLIATQPNIITVSTDGFILQNLTAATAGVPVQQSPRLRLRSHVWNTTATAADNTDDFWIESVPVSGAVPSGMLKFGKSLNGGATTYPMTLSSAGQLLVLGNLQAAVLITGGGVTHITGPAIGQMNITNNTETVGVGLDVTTDGLLKVRTRAQTGDASISVLNLTTSGTINTGTVNFNTTDKNTQIGFQSGLNLVAGAANNTFIGSQAAGTGVITNAALQNTGVGESALQRLTSGAYNTGVGTFALGFITSGLRNTAVGREALGGNSTGNDNVAMGMNTIHQFPFTGNQNTAIGTGSMAGTSSGDNNTTLGYAALQLIVNGSTNTSIGSMSLFNVTGANSGNVALGFSSGKYELGSNAFYIDNQDRVNTAGDKAGAILFGAFNATPASQTLTINASLLVSQKLTKYNGVNTAGWGIPVIQAAGRTVGAVAAVASVATYTVGAADGSFEVSANVLVTTATAHAFTVTVAYTDEGNTARVVTFNFSTIAGVISNAAIGNLAGTVPYEGVPLHIRCKAATTITIATVGTFTTVVYNAEGIIRQLS